MTQLPGAPALHQPGRQERLVVALLTVAFVAVGALWAALTPLFGAPDENAHLSSITRLAEGGGWPAPGDARVPNDVRAAIGEANRAAVDRSTFAELEAAEPGVSAQIDQMTQHPPAYYAIAAGLWNALDLAHWRWDHAMYALRLFGMLLVAPVPILMWASVRRLTASPKAAMLAAAVPLAIPQLAHINGSVNNDSYFVLTAALVGFFVCRILAGDGRWRTLLLTGAMLGLAALSKGFAMALVPLVAAAVLWSPGYRDRSWGWKLVRLVAAGGLSFVLGWFYWLLNIVRFGSLQPRALEYDPPNWGDAGGPDFGYYVDRLWRAIPTSFWGNFGRLDHPLAVAITDFATVSAIFVILMFGLWYASRFERRTNAILLVQLVGTLAILFSGTWSVYVETSLPAGMQGRYLFGLLVPLAVVSAFAWRRMAPAGRRVSTGVVLAVLFALMCANGLLAGYAGFWEEGPIVTIVALRYWIALAPLTQPVLIGVIGIAGATTAAGFVLLVLRLVRPAAPLAATGARTGS